MTRASCMTMLAMFTTMKDVSGSGGFLKTHATDLNDRISKEEVRMSLLDEIEASLGSGIAAKKLHEIEEQLRPMYVSLPKNEYGNLDHSVVRYALHRLFVQRHGWLIKGLDPAGGSFNASSPAGILKTQVSSYIQDLFEERLHGRGLGLHDLAVFAATIEHLIRKEAIGRLGNALALHDILPTSPLSEAETEDVLDTYMMAYVLGQDIPNITLQDAKRLVAQMPQLYNGWNDTRNFMRNMQTNVTAATATHEIDFATLVRVVELAGEHFGSFQNAECVQMKAQLVSIGDHGSGRIRLADFYKPNEEAPTWHFAESVSFLRQSGLLDETDSAVPRVIIANYLTSQTNCIASSSFYSVCCMNECEALLGHIEEYIASSETTVEQIVSVVEQLSSSSVSAPRKLSLVLVQRLNSIAEGHGGLVPIHGRLFSQWMHHAFPRDCPYPHLSGTTSNENPYDWLANDLEPIASEEEKIAYRSTANRVPSDETSHLKELELPWLEEEELLVVRAAPQLQKEVPTSKWSAIRGLLLFFSLGPLALSLVRALKSMPSTEKHDSLKFLV